MKKQNGFIFVETIIVIAVLTTALLLLYSTFTGILNQEKRRAAYDDIAYIYRTYYLMEFYSDVAQRNLSLGIDEENYMVSIPLVASNATDLIPEEERSFYEQLMASTFSATNVYFANGDLSKYEACSEEGSSEVSCDILNDLAGNGWKGYFKTLGDTTENAYIIAVYGVNENGRGGNQCFRIGNDEVTADETECKFYYASIKLDTSLKMPDLHCGTTDLVTGEGPVLNNGLIPVVYENNKWVKADTTKKWYDYCEQWWANAVTVKESVRATYQSASAGTEIPMSAINTMWVWIPRYEYRTDNLRYQYAGGTQLQPGAIDINFISNDTVTPSASNYRIHPAFSWDENNNMSADSGESLSGFWMAKFEISASGATCTPVQFDEGRNCDVTSFIPNFIPNVSSWRGARIGTFWTTIYNQMNGTAGLTTYGLYNADVHVMKNTDWGAVALLSQSKYGKYGNPAYIGANKEIYQNKSNTFKTGNSNGTPSQSSYNTQVMYNVEGTGTGASTTGNIYGIYDMSGGSNEYTMGVKSVRNSTEPVVGKPNSYRNGWTGIPVSSGWNGKFWDGTDFPGVYGYLKDIPKKYYDLYKDSDISGLAGDSVDEAYGWYSDYGQHIYVNGVFSIRSGAYGWGTGAGVFFSNAEVGGEADTSVSTRAVLTSSPI